MHVLIPSDKACRGVTTWAIVGKKNPRVHGDARLLRMGVNGLSRVANNELGGSDDNKRLGSPVNKYTANLPGKSAHRDRELTLCHHVQQWVLFCVSLAHALWPRELSGWGPLE